MNISKYLIIFILLGFCACSSFKERIIWASYPGAYKYGECSKYAISVCYDLQKKGIESRYIEFEWQNQYKKKIQHGFHSIALFKKNDDWFIVDNERPYPIIVQGSNDFEMVKSYTTNITKIREIKIYD